MAKINENSSGLIIGKFMPPHNGHRYLVDFARNYVKKLNVVVCSLEGEPISGELRYKWMKTMFPDVNIIHLKDENPQEPCDHPDFWEIWKNSLERAVPGGAQYLFASESYGKKLAEVLGIEYVPVNHSRDSVPISGTAIRQDPYKNWKYLPEEVRKGLVKKICLIGPESTGKSTLAAALARKFDTIHVGEYGREHLDTKDGVCNYKDIALISRGQIAAEEAALRQSGKVVFLDTDLVETVLWSEILFGKCSDWLDKMADKRKSDLYLLMKDDIPFVPDKQRYGIDKRQLSVERCIEELERRKLDYVVIRGDYCARYSMAVRTVEERMFAFRPVWK